MMYIVCLNIRSFMSPYKTQTQTQLKTQLYLYTRMPVSVSTMRPRANPLCPPVSVPNPPTGDMRRGPLDSARAGSRVELPSLRN